MKIDLSFVGTQLTSFLTGGGYSNLLELAQVRWLDIARKLPDKNFQSCATLHMRGIRRMWRNQSSYLLWRDALHLMSYLYLVASSCDSNLLVFFYVSLWQINSSSAHLYEFPFILIYVSIGIFKELSTSLLQNMQLTCWYLKI